jgi:hypothetical protein
LQPWQSLAQARLVVGGLLAQLHLVVGGLQAQLQAQGRLRAFYFWRFPSLPRQRGR